MSDPLYEALNRFMAVVKEQVRTLRDENKVLAEEMRSLREVQTRSAPEPVQGPPGDPGPVGEPGKDGVGIDHVRMVDGELHIRMSDGEEVNLGRVVGEIGPQGDPGAPSTVPGPQGERGERGADSTVPGPQGERGADGVASVEEIEAIVERRFVDVQTRTLADLVKGVYKKGTEYERGAVVQWDRQSWLAVEKTDAQPGTSPAWKLLAGKGRDGRDRSR